MLSEKPQKITVFETKLTKNQLYRFANEAFGLSGTGAEVGARTGRFRFVLRDAGRNMGSAAIEWNKISTTPIFARTVEKKLKKFGISFQMREEIFLPKKEEK